MVASPLNYPGNKARILKEIIPLFPQEIESFVDVFCGSGIVGLNSSAKSILLNDKNQQIISLLSFLKNNPLDSTLKEINTLIEQYKLSDSKSKPKGYYKIYKNEGLSRYNKEGFLQLRKDYNHNPNSIKLFVLLLFSFNHYLRFNAKGFYNVPVGKMDFSLSLYHKTIEFIALLKSKELAFSTYDFRDSTLYQKGDFFYFDPPYFITDAPYNALWSEKDEKALYEILDTLHSKNKYFALSNVLLSNGKENKILQKWAKQYKINTMKRQYKNANYRRKNLSTTLEVLITNY